MTYKFEDSDNGNVLETNLNPDRKNYTTLSVSNENTLDEYSYFSFDLNKEQLYDLIGALHSIQSKMKNI
tara:strand:+ start:1890 stop:2096 length:207 start_codon:yes stop_codon:yes gene_type:complete